MITTDVKWGYCLYLTGSSQDFMPAVCGFFWDLCSSFLHILQVYSNKGSFFRLRTPEGTWGDLGYCTCMSQGPAFITIHRTICFANTLTRDSLQDAGLSQRNN